MRNHIDLQDLTNAVNRSKHLLQLITIKFDQNTKIFYFLREINTYVERATTFGLNYLCAMNEFTLVAPVPQPV